MFVGVSKLTPTYRVLRSITGSNGSHPVRWMENSLTNRASFSTRRKLSLWHDRDIRGLQACLGVVLVVLHLIAPAEVFKTLLQQRSIVNKNITVRASNKAVAFLGIKPFDGSRN